MRSKCYFMLLLFVASSWEKSESTSNRRQQQQQQQRRRQQNNVRKHFEILNTTSGNSKTNGDGLFSSHNLKVIYKNKITEKEHRQLVEKDNHNDKKEHLVVRYRQHLEQTCYDEITEGCDAHVIHKFDGKPYFAISTSEKWQKNCLLSLSCLIEIEDDPIREPLVAQEFVSFQNLRRVESESHTSEGQNIPPGIDIVKAPLVWPFTKGEGATVCVMDTGIVTNHQDLDYTKISGSNKIHPWRMDLDGHGTHVAGIIAAADNGFGIVGIAPEASIYVVRVFGDNGVFRASDLIVAAEECREAGASIINMSFGGTRGIRPEKEIFEDLYFNSGILSVAAAGNTGGSLYEYPASYEHVMSVGAVTNDLDVARFSVRNDEVNLVAPGSAVESLSIDDDGFSRMSGTSMATPHVSGIAALLKSLAPESNGSELWDILTSTARALDETNYDVSYGWGLVDASAAVQQLYDCKDEGCSDEMNDGTLVECDDGVWVVVTIDPDNYGSEVTWSVKDESSIEILSGGPYADYGSRQTKGVCAKKGCYEFTINDSANDGICCFYGEGFYELTYDSIVVTGTSKESSKTVIFGACEAETEEMKPPVGCDGEDITITLNPDYYVTETSWVVKNFDDQEVMSGGNYEKGDTTQKIETACLPAGCYEFSIYDSHGDGLCCDFGRGSYSVQHGHEIITGANFTDSESHTIGSCDIVDNSERCKTLNLFLHADNRGRRMALFLINKMTGEKIIQYDYGDILGHSKIEEEICIDPSICYRLELHDWQGNGLRKNRSFVVNYDGMEIYNGRDFGALYFHEFGEC